jgi:hypothetical protein
MTMPNRPFRVLLIDDKAVPGTESDAEKNSDLNPANALSALCRRINRPDNFHLFISTSTKCTTQSTRAVEVGSRRPEVPGLTNGADLEAFLKSLDVVVLDLGNAGELRRKATSIQVLQNLITVEPTTVAIAQTDMDAINMDAKDTLTGIGFYHAYFEALCNCRAVFVLTRYDTQGSEEPVEQIVERLINPFCGAEKWVPYTAKYHKKPADIAMLADRVHCLYDLFHAGFTDLDNLADIEIAATHDLPVMIVGESGTGKEGIAKHIHRRWAQEKIRDDERPNTVLDQVTAINCAAIPENLLESELFGHERGAFTGATALHIGKFEELNGGTVFLDEIGDMPLSTQTKILRVLQDGRFQRVGGNTTLQTNVRILTATSDPRFAAFAGYNNKEDHYAPPLSGQWRSREEISRPLRSDLLSRVKVQTIRVVPVHEGNVERIVQQMVAARCTGNFAERWEDAKGEAIDTLVEKFKEQIQRVALRQSAWEAGQSSGSSVVDLPFFGHRREIGQVIDLINAYVEHARKRGARRSNPKVTKFDVEFIYRPSSVLMTANSAVTVATTASSKVDSCLTKQIRNLFRSKMAEFGEILLENFTQGDVRAAAKKLSGKNQKAMTTWMSTYTDCEDAHKQAFAKAFQFTGEKEVKHQTPRTWFAPSRTARTRK